MNTVENMKTKPRIISFTKLKKDLMKDPEFRREYEKLSAERDIARQMVKARIEKRMSQETLAKRIGTDQSVISRLEGMNAKPSISLLKRVSDALGVPIKITIKPTS